MKPLSQSEKKRLVLLLLLCLLPVIVAGFIERRQVNRPRPTPIRVSAQTLSKYSETVSLGSTGFVRLGDQGWSGGPEGNWDIYVSGPPRSIEAHNDIPQGWKVEFVEDLPNVETSGAKTIGVRVTVPLHARQAALVGGATVGLFHARDGAPLYFSESFGVTQTNGKSHTSAHRRPGRARTGHERTHTAPPRR